MAKIAVIGTGGTISTRSALGALDVVDYMAEGTTLSVAEVVDAVPEVRQVAEIVPVTLLAVSSTAIGFAQWRAMAQCVGDVVAEHAVDGIVILHGTATLEETAYMLHLGAKATVPVVVTGSQRPLGAISSDAPGNLLGAVRVAGDPQACGMGVLVCLNNEIHSARDVTKASTASLHAFRSPDTGPLAHMEGSTVTFHRRSVRRGGTDTAFDIRSLQALPRVDIAYCYAGEDGIAVRAFAGAGARGIVVAAFPGGRLSAEQTRACEDAAAQGVAIVLSTRAGSGRAMVASDLLCKGFVAADNLNPQKARVLLSLALAHDVPADGLAQVFTMY